MDLFIKLFLKITLTVFGLILCSNLHSQYGPFWSEERQLSEHSLYKDYIDVIHHFNEEKNTTTALKALDSLALTALNKNDYKQFLFFKNEVSNFYKSENRFDEGYTDLYNSMELFANNHDTLTVEYIASQRLLRSLLRRSTYETRGEGELFQSQLAVLDELGVEGEPLRNTLVDYGLFLMRQGKISKAINILYEVRNYALEADDLSSLAVADYTIITNLPPIYDIQETTMEVLKNDVALFESAEPSIPILVYGSFFNYLIGERYFRQFNEIEKGIYYTRKALASFDTISSPRWNFQATCNSNLALMYAELQDTTNIWKHYKQAKKIVDTRPMSDYNKTLNYINLADAALSVSVDSTLILLDSIKQQPGARFFDDKITEVEARALIKLKETKAAKKLIAAKFDDFERIEGHSIPLISESLDYLYQVYFFELLEEIYRTSGNIVESNKKHHIIANLISKQNQLYHEVIKKDVYGHELSGLIKQYHDFLMPALEYLITLEDGENYDKALQLVFSSKALQLYNNLTKSQLQSQIDNNPTLFSQLMDNSSDIQNVKNQLAMNGLTPELKKELDVELNTLLVDNMVLRYDVNEKEEFEMDGFKIPTLAQIQKKLKPKEGILEYNINDTTLIWTLITKDSAKTGIENIANLSEKITEEVRAIKTGRQTTGIGSILLGDIENEILNLQNLTIIPDKELSYIPFEWLVLPNSGKMLIEELPVSYHYSASLWYLPRDETISSDTQNILAAAPFFYDLEEDADGEYDYISQYRGNMSLSPLYYSKKEVNAIDRLFNESGYEVLSLVGSDANITNTKKYLEKYDIIHLATHGLVNVDYPERSGLFFYPGNEQGNEILRENNFLSLGELMNMELRANLAVLSACDTGMGDLAEGEGVMALPRGFIFAGVPNVIATLWSVHDERTRELMTAFYSHLLAGNSYSEALRLAKLDSIKNGALPLDWAGFVFIGTN